MTHSFDTDFRVSLEAKEKFERDGFIKLKNFLNPNVVRMLLGRVDLELQRGTASTFRVDSRFNRAKYDFYTDKAEIFELLQRPYFRDALTGLTGHDLFLTFELSFEIEKNVNKGLPWHVGVQSFGYQYAEDFGCTLWIPLHPIDTKGQRGGMAYVPEHVISGSFVYAADLAVVEALRARERRGETTTVRDYFGMRTDILNSPVMDELLEAHHIEDDFEPGDAFLFTKTVIHRSVILEEGKLPRRAAYVLRFVDADSRYDINRARVLEFPVERYGQGLLAYKPITRQHIEIAEAGAKDGDILSQCAYFKNRESRMIKKPKTRGCSGI